jgi:hypothetical protein
VRWSGLTRAPAVAIPSHSDCEHTRAMLCCCCRQPCLRQPNYTACLLLIANAPLRCGYFLVERCCRQRACLRSGLHVLPCSALAIGAGPQRSAVLGWVRCNLVRWSVACCCGAVARQQVCTLWGVLLHAACMDGMAQAALALIHPFEWHHIFIPVASASASASVAA